MARTCTSRPQLVTRTAPRRSVARCRRRQRRADDVQTVAGANPTELINDGPTLYIAFDGPATPGTAGGILKLTK